MKTKIYLRLLPRIFMLAFCFLFINSQTNAQCTTNSIYQDFIDALQSGNYTLSCQVTIINAASADRSHYYTAWGQSNLSFLSAGSRLTEIKNCQLAQDDYTKLFYSDRIKSFTENFPQYFSGLEPDEQAVSIDIVDNSIVSESKTWNYSTVYKNVIRNGNILYANLENSMIILNLALVPKTIVN